MFEPGHIFAHRYRIGSRIGSGGMGDVYEARHTLTEHEVALKCLRPVESAGSRVKRSFELEARVDAKVNSPHIVRVQDAGVDDATGSPYLVMELLKGRTLADLIKQQKHGRLRVDQTLDVLKQVARGLDAAHAYGIVHRDLKPENVFITTSGTVKILDFGIAKLLDASEHVTQELQGTPLYMAAEQANGGRVCAQTDIWALGLMAYRALTGRVYWRCVNEASSQPPLLAQIVYEITVSRQDPPSLRLAQQGAALRLPADFDAWLLRCIDRTPARRFESASAAVQALESVFENVGPDFLQPDAAVDDAPPSGRQVTQRTRTYPNAAPPDSSTRDSTGPSASASTSSPVPRRQRSPRARRLALFVLAVCGALASRAAAPLLRRSEPASTAVAPKVEEAREEARLPRDVANALDVSAAALRAASSGELDVPKPEPSPPDGARPAPIPALVAAPNPAPPAPSPHQPIRRTTSPAPVEPPPVREPARADAPSRIDVYGIAPLELAGGRSRGVANDAVAPVAAELGQAPSVLDSPPDDSR